MPIWLDVKTRVDSGSIRKSANEAEQAFDKAGKAAGTDFKDALDKAYTSGSKAARAAADDVKKFADKQKDALGKVRVEEQKLAELRERGVGGSRLVAQQERYNKSVRDEAKATGQTREALQKLNAQQDKASRKKGIGKNLKDGLDGASGSAKRLTGQLSHLAQGTPLAPLARGAESLKGSFSGAGGAAGGMASRIGVAAAGSTAALAGVGAAVYGIGKPLYNLGQQFDDAFKHIRTETGATGAELGDLKDATKAIAGDIPESLGNIGKVVAETHRSLHLTGDDLQSVSKKVALLGEETGAAVNIRKLGQTFRSFGVEAGDMGGVLNQLLQSHQATGTGVNELLSTLSRSGPALQQLGFGIGQSASMLSTLEEAGVDAPQLVERMGQGVAKFAKDGKDAKEAFSETISEVQRLVQVGDQAGAQNMLAKMFGTRGAADMFKAIKSGALDLKVLQSAGKDTGETIEGLANDTDRFREKWQMFKNQLAVKLEPIGSAVFDKVQDSLDGLIQWIDTHQNDIINFATGTVNAMIDVGATITRITGYFTKGIATLGQVAGKALGGLTQGFGKLQSGLSKVFDAVGAHGVADNLKDAAGDWDDISQSFYSFGEGLSGTADKIVDSAQTMFDWRTSVDQFGDSILQTTQDMQEWRDAESGDPVDLSVTANTDQATETISDWIDSIEKSASINLDAHVSPGGGLGGAGGLGGSMFSSGGGLGDAGALPDSMFSGGGGGGMAPSGNMSKQQIADYIYGAALKRGYSPHDATSILGYAIGESGLNPGISGGQQGDDEVIGLFQQKSAFAREGGIDPSMRSDPKANTEAYLNHLEANRGMPIEQALPATSVGGPLSGVGAQSWAPLMAQARGYVGGNDSRVGVGGSVPATSAPAPTTLGTGGVDPLAAGLGGGIGPIGPAPDDTKVRDAQNRVEDADAKVQQAQQKLAELDADAKDSQRMKLEDDLHKAKRNARDARQDLEQARDSKADQEQRHRQTQRARGGGAGGGAGGGLLGGAGGGAGGGLLGGAGGLGPGDIGAAMPPNLGLGEGIPGLVKAMTTMIGNVVMAPVQGAILGGMGALNAGAGGAGGGGQPMARPAPMPAPRPAAPAAAPAPGGSPFAGGGFGPQQQGVGGPESAPPAMNPLGIGGGGGGLGGGLGGMLGGGGMGQPGQPGMAPGMGAPGMAPGMAPGAAGMGAAGPAGAAAGAPPGAGLGGGFAPTGMMPGAGAGAGGGGAAQVSPVGMGGGAPGVGGIDTSGPGASTPSGPESQRISGKGSGFQFGGSGLLGFAESLPGIALSMGGSMAGAGVGGAAGEAPFAGGASGAGGGAVGSAVGGTIGGIGSAALGMLFQQINRGVGQVGQYAGIGAEGLMETLLPNSGEDADPSKSLPGKILMGLAGAHPAGGGGGGGGAGKKTKEEEDEEKKKQQEKEKRGAKPGGKRGSRSLKPGDTKGAAEGQSGDDSNRPSVTNNIYANDEGTGNQIANSQSQATMQSMAMTAGGPR